MLYIYLFTFLFYFGRIVKYVKPFITLSKRQNFNNYSLISKDNFVKSRKFKTNSLNQDTNPSSFDIKEGSHSSYCKSEHYKRLKNFFSEEENELEDTLYYNLKDTQVTYSKETDLYTPTFYTVDSLAIVPELFQENFLLRGEDHWDKLMQIRQKYTRKKQISDKINELEITRSKLARLYHHNEVKDNNLREKNILLRKEIKDLKREESSVLKEILDLRNQLPNLLSNDVPPENRVIKECIENSNKENNIPHFKIIESFSPTYIKRAVEISGKGFSSYSGDLARLSRALVNLMLDTLTQVYNYKEVNIPLIVSKSTLESTGHLPRFEDHLFKIDSENLFNGEKGYLIPTAEVPLVGLFKNIRLINNNLPIFITSYSECFRSEIQDYGSDTLGLIRQHQFGKVELVCICKPKNSDYIHQLMISHIEFILKLLELPYRQVLLSRENTGSTSSKTVDFEVYFPSRKGFVEVSSCSNTRDYQTNRLNTFTRDWQKLHSINGSGLPIGRTLSGILENNCVKLENGRLQINIPQALRRYMNQDSFILQDLKEY